MLFRSHFIQHAWWGKLLGAALGFLIAGPSGALLGVFIGSLFDRGLSEHLSKPHQAYHNEKRIPVRQAFQRATFSIMGHLCKVDGYVSAEEIRNAKTIMQELRLNHTERTHAKTFFQQGKAATFELNEPLQSLKHLAIDNRQLLLAFIQLQYRTAQIGGLTPKKVAVLNTLLSELGLAPLHEQAHAQDAFYTQFHQYTQQKRRYSWGGNENISSAYAGPAPESAYALLNVSSNATQQEVKRAYRKQMSKYHPDKYIGEGLSEAKVKQANEKTQAIRKAYETICKQKGW
ncbi:MAG: co-chaperone DjlA [Legionellaceae bacterium]|nr:co-chaperone DjlA [Legionellaceae bacterium]